MPTRKQTISVRLDDSAKRRIERAARIRRQSSGAFLQKAGEEHARQVLLSWALERHRSEEASFSELAEDTGLPIEELMSAAMRDDHDAALDQFLLSAKYLAEASGNSELARAGERAVETVKRENHRRGDDQG